MAGKDLKTLAEQLKKNHGVVLITTFDDGVDVGSVLNRKDWNDIDRIGHIGKGLPVASLPSVEGPFACMLADFKRNHEMKLDASLSLLAPGSNVKGQLGNVADVVVTFDSPQTYSLDLLQLEDAIEAQPQTFWTRALGQALQEKRTRVVFQVIRSKMSFQFRGSGGAGVSVNKFGLDAGWQWRNEATIESKKELLVAVEYARYDTGKRRFVPETQ